MEYKGDPYLLASEWSFDSRSRLDKYLSALQAVIQRHDILRTAVMWQGLSEPMQVVLRRVALPIEEIQLSVEEGDIANQLYARFDPRECRMDVSQAPLLRIYIAQDE